MTNADMIRALRYCGNFADRDGCDEACPYYNDNDCPKRIMCAAADALEAAEKRIAELEEERNKTVTEIFWEEQSWWENRCKELEAQNAELVTKCIQLEAQMPKRGEWIDENRRTRSSKFVCSACKRTCYDIQPTRNKAWTKRCRYNYCPNCGAKMKGEQ